MNRPELRDKEEADRSRRDAAWGGWGWLAMIFVWLLLIMLALT